MWDCFLGEIRIFCGTFVPAGWALCDGRVLFAWEFDRLLLILGFQFGGDGNTTFALPTLPDPAPGMHYIICIDGAFPSRDGAGAIGDLSEIRLFAGTESPGRWNYCDGSLWPLLANTALFSLLLTRFGGDGTRTYALPKLPDAAAGVKYIICIDGIFPSAN